MRLTRQEVSAIKAAAADTFGATAIVRLFGSRVDDSLRGGDTDLHIEVDQIDDEWAKRADFETALFRRIDPRKVDLILSERGKTPRGFERIAYRDGVIL